MSITGPLSGITVLDLSRILAGPYCTLMLAELGAHVIKVEPPGSGDDARQYGPFINGKSAYFTSINRGKQSIALDLKSPSDLAIMRDLVKRADVLVENFRPGVMARFGLSWDDLRRVNPRLVYASVSGFGQTGPWATKPAYDMVVQGMGGIMSITGHLGGPPARTGISIGDIGAGLYATIAINAALYQRERTGQGTQIDISMLDCQAALLEAPYTRYFATGENPGPLGARHLTITPFQVFEASDGYLTLAAGNDGLFRRLCSALRRPELSEDLRYRTNPLRCAHVNELTEALEETTRTRGVKEWVHILELAGIPCGPVNSVSDAVKHEQILARDMIVQVQDPTMGSVSVIGNPMKMGDAIDDGVREPAPELDGSRRDILDWLAAAS